MPFLLGTPIREKIVCRDIRLRFDNAFSEAGCHRCYLFECLAIRAPIGLEYSRRSVAPKISTLAKGDDCGRDVIGLWRITSVLTNAVENCFKQISRLTPRGGPQKGLKDLFSQLFILAVLGL